MVNVIEKFLLVLGLEEWLCNESTFEVVRHFISCEGENNIVLFVPRISLDDQDIKFLKLNSIKFKESLNDLLKLNKFNLNENKN